MHQIAFMIAFISDSYGRADDNVRAQIVTMSDQRDSIRNIHRHEMKKLKRLLELILTTLNVLDVNPDRGHSVSNLYTFVNSVHKLINTIKLS